MTLCLNSSHRSHGVEPSLACSVFHSASPATYPYSPTPVQANLFPAASLYRSGGDRCIQSGSNCSTLHPSESSISRPELFLLTQNSADYEANFELCAVPTSATIGGTSGSLETKINSNRLHGDHNVQTPVGIGEINRVCLEKLPHIGIKVECGESDASCDEKDGYALSHKDSQYREQQKSSMHFSPSTANDFYERKLGGAKLVNLIPMGEVSKYVFTCLVNQNNIHH
ncbi:unnamed protein product [Protopolystoma xenopodis]|uniref:Uncharacterized protein n=1 Tax=Protopolystoma xenopodis TaxID=117903 RepID=A0A3S5B188_9PLAT|nr:unnamed protein product [Protopolystoma xenopodis]